MKVISPHNYEGAIRQYYFTDGKTQHSVIGIIIPETPKTFLLFDESGDFYEISNSSVCSGNIVITDVATISDDMYAEIEPFFRPIYANAREYVDVVNQIRQLEREKIRIVGERFNLYAERGLDNAVSNAS